MWEETVDTCFLTDLKVTEETAGRLLVQSAGERQQHGVFVVEGRCETHGDAHMDPMKAQQLAAELEVEMMADMYNR